MTARSRGLVRGRKAGADAGNLQDAMAATFKQWRMLYPTAVDIDFAAAIRDLDRERLNDEPSLIQFPELKGHADLLRAERKGFLEASKLDETLMAFHYSGDYFRSRRLDTRHVARYDLLPPPGAGCTGIFFPESKEGGVIIGQNYDIALNPASPYASYRPEEVLKQRVPYVAQGGGSSAVLLDDEPKCCFPANPFDYELFPDDVLNDIEEIIKFLERYNEFWGAGNGIYVDRKWRGVVIEKCNCLMAVRRPVVNGALCATACAYLDPKMGAHQLNRARKAMELKGETEENSPDVVFHLGAGKRYRRLVEMVAAEARAGATLWGAFEIISDHAVPYPERVCLAGEVAFPDREKVSNWTALHHAAVVTGPNKRCLYRSIQSFHDAKPIYHYRPKLMLGKRARMNAKWQADVRAGRCELAPRVRDTRSR